MREVCAKLVPKNLNYDQLQRRNFDNKKSIMVLECSIYSSDVTPYDFFLFPTVKGHLQESHFETMKEIQKVMKAALNNLQRNGFWKGFSSLKQGWVLCIPAGGN
jgi:hypothetical protein